jgi:hypothetical protein
MDTVTNTGSTTTNPVVTTGANTSGYVTPPAQTESPAPTALPVEHMIPKSRLDEEIAKAKKAEAALVKFQEAEDKRKKNELSELDRLKLEKQEAENKATQAQTELQTERERNSILAEASKPQFGDKKMKFCNPEIAYRLLTEDDKSKGIVSALQELAKANPFLLETPAVAGDGVGSPRKGIKSSEEQKPPNYKIPHF